ncbi:MAG: tetratricopeptide repeat protein [Betaproteobacteria bacterium]
MKTRQHESDETCSERTRCNRTCQRTGKGAGRRHTGRILTLLMLACSLAAGCAHPASSPEMGTASDDFESLWDYGQPLASESRFRQAMERFPNAGEAHDQLLTQIARTFSLRGDFVDAHRILDDVETRLSAATTKVRVRYELERGRTFNSSGDTVRALALFGSAWERASTAGLDVLAIDAAHMLAIASPPPEQHAWNLRALALAERSADPRAKKWRVSLYNNIGWTYHDQGDSAAALTMFERALDAALQAGRPEPVRIARWTIARCLRSLGRYADALSRQLALRDDPVPGAADDGYVFEEIGENLLALGRGFEARPSFARAWALLRDDPELRANEGGRLARLRELGGE